MKEIYPHRVIATSPNITRDAISTWCDENGMVSYDSKLVQTVTGKRYWILRFEHEEDWILAKLKWT